MMKHNRKYTFDELSNYQLKTLIYSYVRGVDERKVMCDYYLDNASAESIAEVRHVSVSTIGRIVRYYGEIMNKNKAFILENCPKLARV